MFSFNSFGKMCFAGAAFFFQPFPNAEFFQASRGASFDCWFAPAGAFRADERANFFRDCENIRISEFDEAFRFRGSV